MGGRQSGGKNKQTSWKNGEINLSETRKQRSEKQTEVDKFFKKVTKEQTVSKRKSKLTEGKGNTIELKSTYSL